MQIANTNNIVKGKKIIEEIKETVCNWQKYANKAKVCSELKSSITKNLVALKF